METKTFVQTLETPIKTIESSSEGYGQRWVVLALKPLHSSHPNLNFCKSPPPHLKSSRRQRRQAEGHHRPCLGKNIGPV